MTLVHLSIALSIPLSISSYDLRLYSPLILGLGTTVTFFIQKLEFENRKRASTLVLSFWTLTTLFSAVALYGLIIRSVLHPIYLLSLSSISLIGLCNLILEGSYSPGHHDNYYDDSNLFVKLTYSYVTPLFSQSPIRIRTVPNPPKQLETKSVYKQFSDVWDRKTENSASPSLISTLLLNHWGSLLTTSLLETFTTIIPFVYPLLLKQLMLFVDKYNRGEVPLSQGISIVLVSAFLKFLETIIKSKHGLMTANLSTKIDTTLCHLVHQKALRLSSEAVSETSIGELVNILTNSVNEVTYLATTQLNLIWTIPLETAVCWLTMYSLIGNAMWVGLAVSVLIIPLTGFLARLQTRLYLKLQDACEDRFTHTDNLLSNIKSIKLYGWETTFYNKIRAIRNGQELTGLRRLSYLSLAQSVVSRTSHCLAATASFVFIVVVQRLPLSAADAIPALDIFGMLLSPVTSISSRVEFFIQAWVALQKLDSFLKLSEVEKKSMEQLTKQHTKQKLITQQITQQKQSTQLTNQPVVSTNGTFYWDRHLQTPALTNISLSVNTGETVCIIGKVGSGKTATLLAILGELFSSPSSSSSLPFAVAYSCQTPWIRNGTIKDNILFGSKEDPAFYNQTLEACALSRDLELLVNGDFTQVGEKGISLSGGQKARISIARSVYSRAQVQLYDDPLSAVDEHVQAHLIRHVFGQKGLLGDKTVIIATNTLNLLSHCSMVHVIENKTFVESGRFDELRVRGVVQTLQSRDRSENESSSDSGDDSVSETDSIRSRDTADTEDVQTTPPNLLQLYKKYLSAVGYFNIGVYFSLSLIGSALAIAGGYWVSRWGSSEVSNLSDLSLVFGYLVIQFSAEMSDSLGIFSISAFGAIRASQTIHEQMLKTVLRAPMSYFESTPLGRLTTRFSGDLETIEDMYWVVTEVFNTLLASFSTLLVIIVSSPITLLVIIPALYLYRLLQQHYLRTSRQVTRLTATVMSPIVSHFQETLTGLTTIRAFNKQRFFSTTSEAHFDVSAKMEFLSHSLREWLELRLTLIGVTVFVSTGLSLVVALQWSSLSAGLVGLVMSYASTISSNFGNVVESIIDVDQEAVSLERVFELCQLESEAPLKAKEPPAHWPNEGKITFESYSTKYRAGLDPVLHSLSFTIRPGENVGVVGRTGAGKSSLAMALFRVIEATEGSIIIDGEDISKIGLEDLRSRLSIIPQDAQMFEGTVRSNLDPSGMLSDQQLSQVLELSSLNQFFVGLDTEVNDGGSNLSLGQKQLVCLGRALLTPSSILVLDEATAAVDYETDKVIQEMIRREFKNRTILTIAHRLDTVMDSDRILVLDAGRVVEFDTPETLLGDEDSVFFGLVNA